MHALLAKLDDRHKSAKEREENSLWVALCDDRVAKLIKVGIPSFRQKVDVERSKDLWSKVSLPFFLSAELDLMEPDEKAKFLKQVHRLTLMLRAWDELGGDPGCVGTGGGKRSGKLFGPGVSPVACSSTVASGSTANADGIVSESNDESCLSRAGAASDDPAGDSSRAAGEARHSRAHGAADTRCFTGSLLRGPDGHFCGVAHNARLSCGDRPSGGRSSSLREPAPRRPGVNSMW